MWSNDHQEQFPWQVSEKDGGTLNYAGSPQVAQHFLAASNEFNSPKILLCPSDVTRVRAVVWQGLSNRNLSYFVGLNATEAEPHAVLSGDRTMSTNPSPQSGLVTFNTLSRAQWSKGLHTNYGHVVLVDGSAAKLTTPELAGLVRSNSLRTIAVP